MSDIDDRIAAALRAAANQVTDDDVTPAQPPTAATVAPPRRHIRWIAPVIAAAAVAGIAISVTAVVNHHPQASKTNQPGQTDTPTPTAPTTTVPTSTGATSTAPTSTAPTSASDSSGVNGTGELVCYFADASPCKVPGGFVWYVPLWPFGSYTQAQGWGNELGGKGLWHLDAGETALDFTRSYLGFTDITQVTSTSITGDQAKIGVGYLNPAGQPVTAAVLHLVRYEQYANTTSAPWEVVGSEDTTLSLETPAYDSVVNTTFTAGGHITGVDENLHVWVRSLAYPQPLFDGCCKPAGGDHQPWSSVVAIPTDSFKSSQLPVAATVVVSTGGHVEEHERFAIQGIYVGVSSSS